MQKNTQRLLCIVYEPANFAVWLKLAIRGRRSGDFDVVIWSPYSLPEAERYKAEALAAGSVYVDETTSVGALADIFTPLSGWLSSGPTKLPRGMFVSSAEISLFPPSENIPNSALALTAELTSEERYSLCYEVDRIRRRINFCEDWLVRLGVDAVVLAEDNVERDSYAWIEGAKRRQVRSVVISYGSISEQEAVLAYKGSPIHAVGERQADLVRRYMCHWLAEGPAYAITRIPFIEAVARELTNTAPFNPWIVNTGHVDKIVLESPAMKQVYLDYRFEDKRLKPIGHPVQDLLADITEKRLERRADMFAKHKLFVDRPLAIVAMPPDQLSTRSACYTNYEQIISAFACLPEELAGFNVIISPHPNISVEDLAKIRKTGVALEEMPVAELLPLADLYIACVSSTIKWALGCGIPIVDFDCYGYNYSNYLGLPQVISIGNDDGYRKALCGLADLNELNNLIQCARENKSYWGEFDGMAFDRLTKLLLKDEINDR